MISVRNIIIRFGVLKLSMVLTLSCVIVSLAIYIILAFLTGISIRTVGVAISTLTPLIMAPIFCITILNVVRSFYRAQEEIMKAHAELERKVADRTQELQRTNEQLREEIQERKQAEQYLRDSITLQETLLSNLAVGVIIVDPDSRKIEVVNDFAAAMFGIGTEYIAGHRCHTFVCPAAEGACPICDLGQTVDNSEKEMLCADGSRRPILKSVRKIQMLGQEKLLECFIDITDRKLAEEENRHIEKLSAALEMAGAICHELNQPLQVISGRIEILSMENKDDRTRKSLEIINDQVYRIGKITKKLMGIKKYSTRDYTETIKITDIGQTTEGDIQQLKLDKGEYPL